MFCWLRCTDWPMTKPQGYRSQFAAHFRLVVDCSSESSKTLLGLRPTWNVDRCLCGDQAWSNRRLENLRLPTGTPSGTWITNHFPSVAWLYCRKRYVFAAGGGWRLS